MAESVLALLQTLVAFPFITSGGHMQVDRTGPDAFRLDVRYERNSVRVTPVGEVDIATIGEIDGELCALRDTGSRSLILDLRETTFVDSTCLALALRWADDGSEDGVDFSLIEGSPATQRIFELCGVAARVPFRAPAQPSLDLL